MKNSRTGGLPRGFATLTTESFAETFAQMGHAAHVFPDSSQISSPSCIVDLPSPHTCNQLFQRRAGIASADYLRTELCGIVIPCDCLVPPLGVPRSGISVDSYHRLGEISLSH